MFESFAVRVMGACWGDCCVGFFHLFLGNSYLTPAFVAGLFGARCSGGGLFISFARGNAPAILGSPALLLCLASDVVSLVSPVPSL